MSDQLPDWLAHRAAVLPDREALAFGSLRLTCASLDRRVDALAAALAGRDIRSGDHVALLAANCVEFVEAVHALPRLGAVLVPLNTRLTVDELAWQVRNAEVRLLLTDDRLASSARDVAAACRLGEPLVLPLAPAPGTFPRVDAHAPGDVHSIIYTSGTTGRPKGVLITFGNFWASAVGSALNLGVMPDDRWLACMPLFHVGGLSIVLRSAIYGTAVVLHAGFDEHEVVRSLHGDRITVVSVVPTMLQRILDASDGPCPASLRVVLVGGGPLPPPLLRRALDRGFPAVQTYGLTEAASQVATLAPGDARSHAGSAGKPLLTTRLCIDAPPGEPGEILVAGPTVTPGYFRQPAATAAAIRDEWLHTGDVGRLDADGFLYVLDRRDDLVVSGGENVYPAEVEAVLLMHPAITAAAVVGLPDADWGQVVAAAVVAQPEVDLDAVVTWLRGRLAGYKIPRRLIRVESLPATSNGKVQRRLVREFFAPDSQGAPTTPSTS